MTIFHPLTPLVWAGIASAFLLVIWAVPQVVKAEERVLEDSLPSWSIFGKAAWQIFAILMGKDIKDVASSANKGAWSTRN